jgi:hypothetical protein
VKLVTGRVNARAVIPPAFDLVRSGDRIPEAVTDRIVDWEDAPDALMDLPGKFVFSRP